MAGPIDDDIRALLTAFSDGELDAAQNERALEYLRIHPEALITLEQEQRLRIAARRAILNATPAAPDELKTKIAAMAVSEPLKMSSDFVDDSHRGRRITAVFFACAASVAMGITIGYVAQPRAKPPIVSSASPPGPVSVSTIADITRLHVDCSRMLTVHTGGYPQALDGLADVVEQELNRDKPYPDLSSMGYAFVGAGPCYRPLENTVHLLYKSTKPWINDTLSVFVQPYTGQYPIDPGKAYRIGAENAPHPVLVWRTDQAIYFVVGDNQGVVDKACQKIGLAKL